MLEALGSKGRSIIGVLFNISIFNFSIFQFLYFPPFPLTQRPWQPAVDNIDGRNEEEQGEYE